MKKLLVSDVCDMPMVGIPNSLDTPIVQKYEEGRLNAIDEIASLPITIKPEQVNERKLFVLLREHIKEGERGWDLMSIAQDIANHITEVLGGEDEGDKDG